MKYADNDKSVNGIYTGEAVGSRLADSLSPSDDGLGYVRSIEHAGTITGDSLDTVTLSYDVNGGEGEAPPEQTVNFGASVTVAGYPEEAVAWNDRADGTGKNYTPGVSTFISENLTLYAQYESEE
jgi:hypothetical protein